MRKKHVTYNDNVPVFLSANDGILDRYSQVSPVFPISLELIKLAKEFKRDYIANKNYLRYMKNQKELSIVINDIRDNF